jgi:hypothetical protein
MNEHPNTRRRALLWKLATAIPVGLLLLSGLPFLTAFEAHVVNVTAKIEPRPPKCVPLSLYYWNKHEGCKKGKGSSLHTTEVQSLSNQYGGAFVDISGAKICKLLDGQCAGDSTEQARCAAKQQTLVVYLNLATMRLDPAALLAGADDGSMAFDRLHLSGTSTIAQALTTIENILNNEDTKKKTFQDAERVAKRIIAFYEYENPFEPKCVFDPDDVPVCIEHSFKIRVKNENNAVIDNDVDISVNTGGNSANGGNGGAGGSGGNGGTIVTGEATVNVTITNEVNTNETTINVGGNCTNCASVVESGTREREPREAREGRSDGTQSASTTSVH